MSIRHWTAVLMIGAAAVLILVMLPAGHNSHPGKKTANLTPRQEQTMKQTMLKRDLDATDRLARRDARLHLKQLQQQFEQSPESASNECRILQKTHGHLLEVIPVGVKASKATIRQNSFRPTSEDEASLKLYVGLAKQALKKGKAYESPGFPDRDSRYFIAAEPSSSGKGGIIGVFSTGIMKQVETHQRRNLRMIPYPKEGNYKVESVHPDTLNDVTVRTGHDNENASHYYENEVVVTFRSHPTPQQLAKIKHDIDSEEYQKLNSTYIFHAKQMSTQQLMSYFKKNWSPKFVEPHYLYLTNEASPTSDIELKPEVPNDALFSEYQWNLPITETNRGWNLSKGSNDVIVAVVDTGVDLNHPDLTGRILPGYNVIKPGQKPMDDVGHGTHVAGIISAKVNNGEGIAGMTWGTKILPVKALDKSGSGTTYSVAQGIIWATDHGAKVINLSLGNYAQANFLHEAIKYAYDHDVVLIAATGNDNTERPGYPAAYPEVLSVSATDAKMKRASFSNFGDYVDVMAPGESIASTYPGNQYAALSGTSMASPHVAALAALIRSVNPDLRNTEVMDIIRNNVIDLGNPGHDKYFGYGQIDVFSALKSAGQSQSPLLLWPQCTEQKLNKLMKGSK
ncbi:peptidase S8 [Paenibacillus sp. CAA11]|uniref:S8 family peptidase n=1 Tax=Paenibacillus sp. CAA11 TaxID=1532905 RepID=UPI000D3B7DC0|nr:S8 family peptidase [Paenibacillus sp. CAA11]AWB45393.1 peptidase S8 [Paenibacillus sp. CAA11]